MWVFDFMRDGEVREVCECLTVTIMVWWYEQLWHGLSKTLAEKTAWALAMDRGVNMVSVNGGLLMDSDLSIKTPYLRGAAEMYEDGVFVTVDLDFLVDAHICVYEDISSYGRYLCFNHIINTHHHASLLARKLTPSAPSMPQRSVSYIN